MADCALPEQAANIFSLVCYPSQETLDEWHSNPPIPDSTTGFGGASGAKLRFYTRERLAELRRHHASSLSRRRIAVLDGRSPTETQWSCIIT